MRRVLPQVIPINFFLTTWGKFSSCAGWGGANTVTGISSSKFTRHCSWMRFTRVPRCIQWQGNFVLGLYCLGQFFCKFSSVLTISPNLFVIKAKSFVRSCPTHAKSLLRSLPPVSHHKNEKKTTEAHTRLVSSLIQRLVLDFLKLGCKLVPTWH